MYNLFIIYLTVVLSLFGFLEIVRKKYNIGMCFMVWILFYVSLLFLGVLIGGSDIAFDPLRVFEFLIYPASVLISYFLVKLKQKSILLILLIYFFGGLFIYPPILVFEETFEDTVFFDVRSYIRDIPPQAIVIFEWSKTNEIELISKIPNLRDMRLLYGEFPTKCKLITNSDKKILEYYSHIHSYLSTQKPDVYITPKSDLVYFNNWGQVYC